MSRALLAFGLAILVALAAAGPASAHAVLESTSPERGVALATSPSRFVLRFSEPVEIAFGAVRVYDARGGSVEAGPAAHPRGDERSVAVPLRPELPDGGYTVTFRVVSADSHPVSGGFVFSVGKGGPAAAASVSDLLGERAGPVTSVAFAAVRTLQFGAIAVAIGALAILVLVWLPALAAESAPGGAWPAASAGFARRWRRLMTAAAVAGAAAAALALPLQAATAAGTSFWAALPETRAVLDTRFGTVWALGGLAWLGVLVLTATRFGRVPAVRPATLGAAGIALTRTSHGLLALAALLLWLACLPALSGHAGVQEPVVVLLPANVVHVVAAGAWIGGLAALLVALPSATRQLAPADRARALAATLRRFSSLALIAVAALLAGGIVQSLLELSAVRDLVETAYGRAILVKIALVAVLLGLGALNRGRNVPAISAVAAAGDPPGRAGSVLRRTMRAEVLLGAAALVVTGALAGYSPEGRSEAGPFSATADIGPARAELTVEPARAGANEIHLYLFDRRDGSQWDATKELTARASLPDRGIAPIRLRARKAGPGHYVAGGAPLAPAGDWRLELAARVSEFDDYRTTFTVPIK